MPAKDLYHDVVVQALIVDGWTITDDPLYLTYGGSTARRKSKVKSQKSKVLWNQVFRDFKWFKSFLSLSPIRDLHEAVGKYDVYRTLLLELEPERLLYLAISKRVYEGLFSERFGQLILNRIQIRLIIFDEKQARIVQWIN
jgi:hypothetical protein